MSTPSYAEFDEDAMSKEFDEEAMARDMAIVLAALEEGKEAATAGYTLQPADDIFGEIEPAAGWDSTRDESSLLLPQQQDVVNSTSEPPTVAMNTTETLDCAPNTTQTLDCAPNTTLTLECAPNTTQTLDCAPNTTQTLDCAPNTTQMLEGAGEAAAPQLNTTQTIHSEPNTTQTLECAVNTTQTLEGTRGTAPQLNSTQTLESHANTTQTIEEGNGLHAEAGADVSRGGDCDVMKMSVDESSASKGENSSMALSSDSIVVVEDMPIDSSHSISTTELNSSLPPPALASTQTSEPSASASQAPAQSLTANDMQVDETASGMKAKVKDKAKAGKSKMSVPTATSKPSRLTKPRESRLSSTLTKSKEQEKSPEKVDPPPKPIQKSKPKSKWADISKQIEKNAKSPKPAPKPIQSKLSAAALRRPERTTSVSSDISQSSQASTGARADSATSKKPLKRHTLIPPSTGGQKQEFKKPRATLLPPPFTAVKTGGAKAKSKIPAEGKLKASKIASVNGSGGEASVQNSGGPPPDVVSSNTLSPKAKSTGSKAAAKADKSCSAKATDELQGKLDEALRVVEEKNTYSCGLRKELQTACRGVEGLGVVTQYLTQCIDDTQQELARSREASTQLSLSHSQQLFSYQQDTELLTKNHEEEKRAVIAQLTEERDRDRLQHALECERMREEMSRVHTEDVDRLSAQHEKERATLVEEIEALKLECSNWRVRYDEATEALHKDMDHRLQVALQPYTQLPQEIESLKTVVELKSTEMKDLRCESNVYKQKVETIPDLEKKLYDTEQKLENVQAILDIVSAKEKETAEKYHKITRKAVQEKKENHRLSLNVEALELKLEEAEFTNSIHHVESPSELDISTASLPAYGIDNADTSPSQFTRSFSRSSMKRSQRGSINNNTALEIPEDERQISPAKHLVFRSPSSSPSPTRVTTPRKVHTAVSPVTSPYNRSFTLPRSYRTTNKHQRCNSDSGDGGHP